MIFNTQKQNLLDHFKGIFRWSYALHQYNNKYLEFFQGSTLPFNLIKDSSAIFIYLFCYS